MSMVTPPERMGNSCCFFPFKPQKHFTRLENCNVLKSIAVKCHMKIMPITVTTRGNCLIDSAALLLKKNLCFFRLYQFSVYFLITLRTVIVKNK